MLTFTRATKTQSRARIALVGPSGSGKTYSALRIARGLAGPAGRVAVIDTEHGSAAKYADIADFDVLGLTTFAPATYIEAIGAAVAAGYDVLVIDSLSHAWIGKDGALDQVDRAAKKSQSGNSFTAWRDITPQHNALVEAMLQAGCHLVVTMRAKTEYVMEPDSRGKMTPRKVGMAPVQRDGLEYEFDIVADIDLDHNLIVSKTRCAAIDGAVVARPGEGFGVTVLAWLTDGAPMPTLPSIASLAATNGHAGASRPVAPPPKANGRAEPADGGMRTTQVVDYITEFHATPLIDAMATPGELSDVLAAIQKGYRDNPHARSGAWVKAIDKAADLCADLADVGVVETAYHKAKARMVAGDVVKAEMALSAARFAIAEQSASVAEGPAELPARGTV